MSKPLYFDAIYYALDNIKKEVLHTVVDITELCEILEDNLFDVFDPEEFNLDDLDFFVERKYEANIDDTELMLSGEYVSLCEWKDGEDIEEMITLYIATKKRSIYFSEEKWERFANNVMNVIHHEIIHAQQSHQRNGAIYGPMSITTYKGYYGTPDEVDAYAFNAATELLLKSIPLSGKLRQLKHSETVTIYNRRIKGRDRKVFNSFLKKLYYYYNVISESNQLRVNDSLYQQAS